MATAVQFRINQDVECYLLELYDMAALPDVISLLSGYDVSYLESRKTYIVLGAVAGSVDITIRHLADWEVFKTMLTTILKV